MAAERTVMDWIRTSISMIGFGFTLVGKLFQAQKEANVLIKGPGEKIRRAEGVGILLISLGTFVLIVAILEHRRQLNLLRTGGLESRFGLTLAVASVLAILGVMALFALAVSF